MPPRNRRQCKAATALDAGCERPPTSSGAIRSLCSHPRREQCSVSIAGSYRPPAGGAGAPGSHSECLSNRAPDGIGAGRPRWCTYGASKAAAGRAPLRPEDQMADLTLVCKSPDRVAACTMGARHPKPACDHRASSQFAGAAVGSPRRQGGRAPMHTLIAARRSHVQRGRYRRRRRDGRNRRHPFDITSTIRQVIELLAPLGPEGFSIDLASSGCHLVLGNHTEVFRIVFNVVHNALSVARSSTKLRRVDISIESMGPVTVVHIADDGGGLSAQVLDKLFRAPAGTDSAHGHGIADRARTHGAQRRDADLQDVAEGHGLPARARGLHVDPGCRGSGDPIARAPGRRLIARKCIETGGAPQ